MRSSETTAARSLGSGAAASVRATSTSSPASATSRTIFRWSCRASTIGADGPTSSPRPHAEGSPRLMSCSISRVGPAPDARQPDAGKRDRHPGGAFADPEPPREEMSNTQRVRPARAAAADQAELATARARQRRWKSCARQGDAAGSPKRLAARPISSAGASIRFTPRARAASCGPTSNGSPSCPWSVSRRDDRPRGRPQES